MSSHVSFKQPASGEYFPAHGTSVVSLDVRRDVRLERGEHGENATADCTAMDLVAEGIQCKTVRLHLEEAEVEIRQGTVDAVLASLTRCVGTFSFIFIIHINNIHLLTLLPSESD